MSKNKNKICVAMNPKVIAANIAAAYMATALPAYTGQELPGQIVAANASMFIEANRNVGLTDFAVGYRDPNDIGQTLEHFAPEVWVPNRFSYLEHTNAEEFNSETIDDLRPIRGDFKTVEYTATEREARLENRGLRIVIDIDQVDKSTNWQQQAVGRLMRRLSRNSLRRAVALLSAAAVNTAKTWDSTAGKDPDQDVIAEAVIARTASGVGFNRIGYSDTAWSKRALAHRAQNTAGGFASATLTPQALAALLMVDAVAVSKERYQSTASAKAEILGALVLMFQAQSGLGTEDPSNIKRFVGNTDGGTRVAVYIRQISTKLWEIVVECYEKTVITSTLGIRQFTIS